MSEINERIWVVTCQDTEAEYEPVVCGRFPTRRAADAFWGHLLSDTEGFRPIKMERIELVKEV